MKALLPLVLAPRRRHWLWCALRFALLGAWLASNCGNARAEADVRPSEYQIKAAFLCKFGNFVDWPPEVFAGIGAPFIIAVAGADDVTEEVMRAAAGLLIDGRPIVVRKLRRGDSIADVRILFVARSAESQLRDWLAIAKPLPVLTVTESDQGLALGSIVNFVVVDNKVRFDIAMPPSEPSAVRVNSRLLGVARKVVARGTS